MALACEPDLVIADEPTTALDVIVQDRILREMKEVQAKLNMSMIYISHDMAVIAEVSDVVGVMYAGKIVEYGPTSDDLRQSRFIHTQMHLMSAFPSVKGEKRELSKLYLESRLTWSTLRPGVDFILAARTQQTSARSLNRRSLAEASHWAACWNPIDD